MRSRPLGFTTSSGAALALTLLAVAVVVTGCGDASSTGPVPGLPPTVVAVDPEVLHPGDTAVVHGLNFASSAADVRVQVAGAEATVLPPATTTRLRIQVPASGDISCEPARPVELSVTVAGRTGTSTHPLSPVDLIALTAGAWDADFGTAEVRCHGLPAGDASYLVSVFNAADAAGHTDSFRVRARLGSAGAGDAAPEVSAPAGPSGGAIPTTAERFGVRQAAAPSTSLLAAVLEGRRAEARIVDRGREVLRRRGGPVARQRIQAPPLAAEPPPSEGELIDFRVPDVTRVDACANYDEITARVVHVTSTAVVVEDTAAPLAGQMDSVYRALAREYETVMDPIIRENFGDPLVMDDRLNDDDHFYMLFTPRVNDVSGILAFVWGGDYTGREACASSDEAEMFYGLVPTRTGSAPFDLATVGGWERVMRSTTIHEVKHIAAFAAHRAGGSARQEDSWLEEATAMVAEEIYAREIFGYGARDNTTYQEGIRCEMEPGAAGCGDAPLVMAAHFSFLREYLSAVENRSPLGGGLAFLGGGWWMLRWSLDHAPQGEASFLRALTVESSLFGVENLEARMGRSFPEMLADWTVALEADDRPDLEGGAPERPELTVPSWDVRSVFAGLHDVRPESFPSPFPLIPRQQDYGDYLFTVNGLPGGSAMLLEITATGDRRQLLEILGPGGGPPSPDLGFSILRIR